MPVIRSQSTSARRRSRLLNVASIKIAIMDQGKETLVWHSNDMDEFMCAVTIRAMASAVEKPVVEAVLDSVIARIVQEESITKGCEKAGIPRGYYYRRLKNAS